MNACSFHGSWVGGPEIMLALALGVALLLAPIGIGAVIGGYRGRRQGRPWRGAIAGGAAVLGVYLTLIAIWWATQYARQLQRAAEMRAEEALLDPIRKLQPGDWSRYLESTDPALLPAAQRQAWAWTVLRQASQPEPWTPADLDALGRLPPQLGTTPANRETALALSAIVVFARDGEIGLARVLAECGGDPDCERAIDNAVNLHDQVLLTRAEQNGLLWQAQPLAADVRAALERLLVRQRAYAMDWGNRGDARLAFDRVASGELAHALEACDVRPGVITRPEARSCLGRWLDGMREHGAARLCADAPLAAPDRAALADLRVTTEATDDRELAARLAALEQDLLTTCVDVDTH